MQRKRFLIEGIVQGVGFRPFVYQTAQRLGLAGWVRNDSRGVTIEAEGRAEGLAALQQALREELPPLATVSRLEIESLPVCGEEHFVIRVSDVDQEKTAQIAPDAFVCADCLDELFDPADRRYLYPFINCTNCGPRYSIVTGIPYDRSGTTMADFLMCTDCRGEYKDPASRRFHAQPNACPHCGPRLMLRDGSGRSLAGDPLAGAIELLREGRIVAVKGLGGYHLAVDAANHQAVSELRRRKARDEKPFAVMSYGLEQVAAYAVFDETEKRLLAGTERPIVLLRQRPEHSLSPLVAPRNHYFGVMLPYTPLHFLLLRENFLALVMTSGNLAEEPIAFADADAARRLGGIADAFLLHDRRIHIRTDDSIARLMAGKPLLLRRSRGYVPRTIFLPRSQPPVLAVGAELKNTICLTRGDRACLSQHVGDLQNPETFDSFECTIGHLQQILDLRPQAVAHDLHPDYYSSRFADRLADLPKIAVQHHHAHLASCLAENGVDEEVIGLIYDGTGYGSDGRIWGGEFLVGGLDDFRRAGHFAYLPMPGGDAAVREPWRMALSCLVQAHGENFPRLPFLEAIPEQDLRLLLQMIARGVNSPLSSSCGRLFDAVAALCGVRQRISYEGQAALELEMAMIDGGLAEAYSYAIEEDQGVLVFRPEALILGVVEDLRQGSPAAVVSARFHETLAAMSVDVCRRLRRNSGLRTVALSGGVFQNCHLTERLVQKLRAEGFRVLTHSLVPPNDGGLALGQAAIAGRRLLRY